METLRMSVGPQQPGALPFHVVHSASWQQQSRFHPRSADDCGDRSHRLASRGKRPARVSLPDPHAAHGSALERYQIALFAALCTVLTEIFDNYDWLAWASIPRDILIFAAFVCAGLFTFEVVRSRQVTMRHAARIETEMQARREAEEQLQVLIESSPAGVFTADSTGILLANEAAHRLFGVEPGSLIGRRADEFLPSLENLPALSRGRSRLPYRHAVPWSSFESENISSRTSGSPLSRPTQVRGSRRWWWTPRKIFAAARN